MAEGDIIRDLLRSHIQQDDRGFRRAAESLIDHERRRNHRLLADDLERILFLAPPTNGTPTGAKRAANGRTQPPANGTLGSHRGTEPETGIPRDQGKGLPLLTVRESKVGWDQVILEAAISSELESLFNDYRKAEVLASAGLRLRNRVLFCGPPGCGKTLTAELVAGELKLPLVTVRLDAVVSSFLGETASNLRRIFDFIAAGKFVVLFDEFDALGRERDREQDHGELHRVVNALLQLIDDYSGESLIIFATNHQRMLDEALWRRFELILPFGFPKSQDRTLMLRRWFGAFSISASLTKKLVSQTDGASGSDVRWLASEVIRRVVLDGRSRIQGDDLDSALRSYGLRRATIQGIDAEAGKKRRKRTAAPAKTDEPGP